MSLRLGWSTLETLLVLPVLVFILYFMIQISLVLVAKISLTYANYLGVMAVTRNGGDCQKAKELINDNLEHLKLRVDIECGEYQPGYYRVITVADYRMELPVFANNSVRLEARGSGYSPE